MRIIGIDPGLTVTGYGLIEVDSTHPRARPKALEWGAARTSARDKLDARLKKIADLIRAKINRFEPERMAIESQFVGKDARASLKIGYVKGALTLVGADRGLKTSEYAPKEIKAALTGYGAADKDATRAIVVRMLRLDAPPAPLDASDALAVALTEYLLGSANRLAVAIETSSSARRALKS